MKRMDRFAFIGVIAISTATILNPWVVEVILNRFMLTLSEGVEVVAVMALDIFVVLIGIYLMVRNRTKLHAELTNWSMAFMSIALCFATLEVSLRVLMPSTNLDLAYGFERNVRRETSIYIEGVEQQGVFSTNDWGFRGDPIPANVENRFTIFTIGASTTLCRMNSDERTWSALLQRHLLPERPRALVQNAGVSGHTSSSHLRVLNDIASAVRIDMAIFLIGANDLVKALDHKMMDSFQYIPIRDIIIRRSEFIRVIYTWYQILVVGQPNAEWGGVGISPRSAR